MSNNQPLYLIAQDIRSLQTVGSLFRSADAFLVDKIFLCGCTGQPPRVQITKTALGAEKTVPWEYCDSTVELVKKLKERAVQIVALELCENSKSLHEFKPKFPLALIVGHETRGITLPVLKLADEIVHISMYGVKESLNVSVAAGVALYELNKCRRG